MATYTIKRFSQDPGNLSQGMSQNIPDYNQNSSREERMDQELIESQRTSRDLQIEQMRMQRAMMQNQRMKQKLQAQERQDSLKSRDDLQKIEQKKEEQDQKSLIQSKKLQKDSDSGMRQSLVKRPTIAKTPIPMK